MGNKFSGLSAADRRESKLDEKLAALAAAEDWAGVLAELDLHHRNEERRHKAHRADLDITLMERMAEDGDTYRQKDLMQPGRQEELDEYIFSRDPEDLPQLMGDYPVCESVEGSDARPAEGAVGQCGVGILHRGHSGGAGVLRPECDQAPAESLGEGAAAGDRAQKPVKQKARAASCGPG